MISRFFRIIIKILLFYGVLGFVVVPALLHLSFIVFAPRVLNEPLDVGAVTFNPFTLRLQMQHIELGPDDAPLVKFNNLDAALSWSSLSRQQLVIRELEIAEPFADLRLAADGTINLSKIVKTSEAPASPVPAAETTEASNPVPVIIHSLSVQDAQLQFTDYANTTAEHPFKLNLSDLSLKGSDLWLHKGTGQVQLSGKTGAASFAVAINLQPEQAISADITLNKLPLPVIQPYLTPQLFVAVKKGTMSGTLSLTHTPATKLAVQGTVRVDNLRTRDTRRRTRLAGWDSLALSGIDYRQSSNTLKVATIALTAPSAVVDIDKELQVNLARLVRNAAGSDAGSSEANGSDASNSEAADLAIIIPRFTVTDGTLEFSDHSFKPGFSAPVRGLQGEISGFHSRSPQPVKMVMNGHVDKYSAVQISGQIIPTAPLDETRISLSFKDLELTTLTHYAGRFAGYSVRKGRMNLALDYAVDQGQLKADNHLLLTHLTLGNKVESSEATSLPLKLAIALLKDSDGRILVDLPISGDLDNPEFELGPVIRTALVNLLTNIISAPFKLLASLVPGADEEMSKITFAPGHSTLDATQQQSIQQLAQAISQRPQLQLEIAPVANPIQDNPALAEQHVQAWLINEYRGLMAKAGKPLPADELPVIPEEQRLTLLQQLAVEKGLTAAPESTAEQLHQQIITIWPVPVMELHQLAVRRAQAIKDGLIEKGLAPGAVFIMGVEISSSNPDSKQNSGVTTELKVSAD